MAPRDRSGADHLTHFAQLTETPEKLHIFHALRIIEATYADAPRLGESRRPRDDKVRLGQEAELSFPPSSIRSFTPPTAGKPARLTNRFFGLFGPQGPLPLHMTEFARDRQRNHRDPTFVDFANMLTHRMMSLFYRAWASGQPAPSLDRGGNDPVEKKIAALSGLHGAHLRQRDAFPDFGKRHFTGLLAQGPKNAEGLISVLSAFFGAKVEIQQFVGSWLQLEPDDRWSLGAKNGLGQTTSIGTQVWTRSAKFRVRMGPLKHDEYKRLLPGSDSLQRLAAIVRNYAGDALECDVNLVLKGDEIPASILGKTTQLGQTSWIGEPRKDRDADDLYLTLDNIAANPAT